MKTTENDTAPKAAVTNSHTSLSGHSGVLVACSVWIADATPDEAVLRVAKAEARGLAYDITDAVLARRHGFGDPL